MGGRYAKAAIAAARDAQLGDASTRLLFGMAAGVLDNDSKTSGQKEGLYFAGRIAMAMILGRGHPDPNDADSHAAHVAVEGHVRRLRDAGLIETVQTGSIRGNAVYSLAPLRRWMGGPVPTQTQAQPVPTGQAQPVPQVQAEPAHRYRPSLSPRRTVRNQLRNHEQERRPA